MADINMVTDLHQLRAIEKETREAKVRMPTLKGWNQRYLLRQTLNLLFRKRTELRHIILN